VSAQPLQLQLGRRNGAGNGYWNRIVHLAKIDQRIDQRNILKIMWKQFYFKTFVFIFIKQPKINKCIGIQHKSIYTITKENLTDTCKFHSLFIGDGCL